MDIPSSVPLLVETKSFNVSLFIIMLVLVLVSGFFSMSETLINTVNKFKLEADSQTGKKGSQKALWLTNNYDKMLTTILVGNNIVNIALATISVSFFANILANQNYVELVSTLVITLVVLIFGEIMPKRLANAYADQVLPKISYLLYFIYIIFFPITIIFVGLEKLLTKKETKEEEDEDKFKENEFVLMLDNTKLEDDEEEMIHRILKLNDREVKDIMTPRMQVVAIDDSADIEEIKDIVFESQYSRIPVYHGDKDHIIGVLYERDFMTALVKKKAFKIKSLIKPAKFVKANTKIDDLIKELKRDKVHIAMVSGEYGDIIGIVTMEDALEEIVGEIYDEHDDKKDDVLIKKINDNEYQIDTQIYLEELFEQLDLGEAPEPQYSTLGVWLYGRTTSIPEEGTNIIYVSSYYQKDEEDDFEKIYKKLTFVVTKVENRQILAVRLFVEEISEEEAQEFEED